MQHPDRDEIKLHNLTVYSIIIYSVILLDNAWGSLKWQTLPYREELCPCGLNPIGVDL